MKSGSPAPTVRRALRPPTPATELAPSAASAAAEPAPAPGRIPAPFFETCAEAFVAGTRRGLFEKEAACLADPRRARLLDELESVTPADRREAVDWLLGLSFCGRTAGDFLRVERETLGLAVAWLDRVLASRPLPREDLRLLACACLQLASKWEEYYHLDYEELLVHTGLARSVGRGSVSRARAALLEMEAIVTRALDWRLGVVVPAHWAPLLLGEAGMLPGQREGGGGGASGGNSGVSGVDAHLPERLMSLLVDAALYSPQLGHMAARPSHVAAVALLVTRQVLGLQPAWTPELTAYIGYTADALAPARSLLLRHCAFLLKPPPFTAATAAPPAPVRAASAASALPSSSLSSLPSASDGGSAPPPPAAAFATVPAAAGGGATARAVSDFGASRGSSSAGASASVLTRLQPAAAATSSSASSAAAVAAVLAWSPPPLDPPGRMLVKEYTALGGSGSGRPSLPRRLLAYAETALAAEATGGAAPATM